MIVRTFVVAGVLGLSSLAAGQATGSSIRPEAILPPDTLAYLGTDDVEAMRASAKASPSGQILAEQEVKEFFDKPLAELRKAIDAGLALAKQEPTLADVELNPDKMLAGPYGRAFVALTHFQLPTVEAPTSFDVGLVIGIEALQGGMDLIGTIQQVLTAVAKSKPEGGTFDTVTVDGFSYDRFKPADAPMALCFGKLGGLHVMTLSERTITEMAKRAAGGLPSLLSSPDYTRCTAAVGGSSVKGDFAVFIELGRLLQLAADGIEVGMKINGQTEQLTIVSNLLHAMNFSAFGPSYSVATWRDGVAVSTSYSEVDSNAPGLAALTRPTPIDRGLVAMVPKDALSFSLGSFELAPLWDMVMNGLKDASAEMHQKVIAQIRNVETLVGGADEQGNPNWDIRRDLIGAIGGRMMNMTIPGAGSMIGPGGDTVFWIETKNPEALEKSLKLLFAIPGTYGYPINFKEQMQGEVKLHVLDPMSLGPAAVMAGNLSLTWAIDSGKFWFSTSSKAMKKSLTGLATPPAENITAKADFATHFVEPPQGAVITSLSYSDTATNFENTYTAVLGYIPLLLPMLQQQAGMDELPIDVSLLPTAEAISKHLFGTVSVAYSVGNGHVSVSRGPFGVETSLAAGAAVAAIAGVAGRATRSMAQPADSRTARTEAQKKPSDPAEQAHRDIAELNSAITVFMIEYGKPPATLAELTQPKPEYPQGFLSGAAVPKDPWGHAYSYTTDGVEHYTLGSFGVNGTDDSGSGDDIVHKN